MCSRRRRRPSTAQPVQSVCESYASIAESLSAALKLTLYFSIVMINGELNLVMSGLVSTVLGAASQRRHAHLYSGS